MLSAIGGGAAARRQKGVGEKSFYAPDEGVASAFFGGSMLDLDEKLLNFLVDLIGLALKMLMMGDPSI
jgi:hypothetical protein